jgi:lipoteichoic acid synthase
MMNDRHGVLRRIMGFTLIWLERLKLVDLLLFLGAMLFKLYWFNLFINQPKMMMNFIDGVIEVGALMMLCSWTLWLPARGRIVALIALNVFVSFVLYADLIYYRYFQDIISVPVLLQLSQVDSLGGSISTLLQTDDFILFFDWLVVIPFGLYAVLCGRGDLRAAKRRQESRIGLMQRLASLLWSGSRIYRWLPLQRVRQGQPLLQRWQRMLLRFACGVAVLVVGSMLVFTNVNHAKRTWGLGIFEGAWWNVSIYNVTGAVGFHGYDIYRYAKQNWFNAATVSAAETSEAEQWIEARGKQRGLLEQDKWFGAYAGSNVLMVQLEAFHNFMLNETIGGQEITPHLNELITKSAYFSQFYHQTAQGRTSDADFTANCSFQPVPNGSVFIQYSDHDFDCMPSTLKANGYATNVFHAYEGGFWNRNTMYRNMNYDQFYSLKHFELDEKIGWALGDKSFFRQSMDVIAVGSSGAKEPFYSFLITLSSHHPYTMPAAEKSLELGELEGTLLGDYLQAVHYVDAALGELIDRMKAEGLWDNTILALYGDHDNSVKDWSLFETFYGKPLSELERQMLFKQVPFIVHLPQDGQAGEYTGAGGQLDVTPTLLHLLGISTADQYLTGQPLLTAEAAALAQELKQAPESKQRPNLRNNRKGKLVVQRNGAFTDGEVYYMPAGDGIAANGQCWSIPTGTATDLQACLALADQAAQELTMSDQIVMNDLIAFFRERRASEARADSGNATG